MANSRTHVKHNLLTGRADLAGLLQAVQPMPFMLSRFQLLDKIHKEMNRVEVETGRQSGLIYIYDLECIEMDPFLLPLIAGPLRIFWTLISDNCPELISKIIVINTPSFTNVLYKAIAPFLPDHTKVRTSDNAKAQKRNALIGEDRHV